MSDKKKILENILDDIVVSFIFFTVLPLFIFKNYNYIFLCKIKIHEIYFGYYYYKVISTINL